MTPQRGHTGPCGQSSAFEVLPRRVVVVVDRVAEIELLLAMPDFLVSEESLIWGRGTSTG